MASITDKVKGIHLKAGIVDSELTWPVLVAHQLSASSAFVLLWAELVKGSSRHSLLEWPAEGCG
ncbi:MAG: hypothetical protein ACREC4_08620, partial [Methylocella sp.]